jgi:hypothetical protein
MSSWWVAAPSAPPPAALSPPPVVPPASTVAQPLAPSIWRDFDPLRFADGELEAAYTLYAAEIARGGDGARLRAPAARTLRRARRP